MYIRHVKINTDGHTDTYCVQIKFGHYQVQIPAFPILMDAGTACQGQRSAYLSLALYPTVCVLLQKHMQFLSTKLLRVASVHYAVPDCDLGTVL